MLDQDEILFDLIKKYELYAIEKEDSSKSARMTLNETSLKEDDGFFSFIKSAFVPKSSNSLTFKKIIFLTK